MRYTRCTDDLKLTAQLTALNMQSWDNTASLMAILISFLRPIVPRISFSKGVFKIMFPYGFLAGVTAAALAAQRATADLPIHALVVSLFDFLLILLCSAKALPAAVRRRRDLEIRSGC